MKKPYGCDGPGLCRICTPEMWAERAKKAADDAAWQKVLRAHRRKMLWEALFGPLVAVLIVANIVVMLWPYMGIR